MPENLVQVRYDPQALAAIERSLRGIPNAMRRVIPPSLNRVASWTRTRVRREVAAQLGFKQRRAMGYVILDRATRVKWSSGVLVSQRTVAIGQFAYQGSWGVTAFFPSGQTKTYPGAFVATMPSGHVGVFERGGEGRREWRVSPRTGKRYKTELPIYEMGERLSRVLDLGFVKPLSMEGLSRLDTEIAGRIKAVVLGTMGSRQSRPRAA